MRYDQNGHDKQQPAPRSLAQLSIDFDSELLRQIVKETLQETFDLLDWPIGRICLTEEEAATACGVGRHVLRDLRLAGRLQCSKLGKRYVYRRCDLIEAMESGKVASSNSIRRGRLA